MAIAPDVMDAGAGIWDRMVAGRPRHIFRATLCLVGFGRIARAVARKVTGFEMKVPAYDPYTAKEHIAAAGVEPVSLDELLQRSDYVSLHTPRKVKKLSRTVSR